MTKKDYQALARAIYFARQRDGQGYFRDTLANVVDAIASELQADNGRFDRARFVEACETGTTRGMRKEGR